MSQFGTVSDNGWVRIAAPWGHHARPRPRRLAAVDKVVQRFRHDLTRGGAAGLARLAGRGVGLLCRYPAHRRWMQTIGGATTAQLLAVYPRIAYRHSTTYLFEGADWGFRVASLETHYRFLNATLDRHGFGRMIGPGGLPVWHEVASGRDLAVTLTGPCTVSKHREGELGLRFTMDGTVLYNLAFSVVATADLAPGAGGSRLAFFVGQVQGGRDCRDLIRDAARLCGDNAPRDLLMSALAGLGEAWAIDRIFGVEASRSLSRGTCVFDHNTFWEQYGGVPTVGGHYALTLPFHQGVPQANSAAHRRRTLRKRAYKAALTASVATLVRDLPQPAAAADAAVAGTAAVHRRAAVQDRSCTR